MLKSTMPDDVAGSVPPGAAPVEAGACSSGANESLAILLATTMHRAAAVPRDAVSFAMKEHDGNIELSVLAPGNELQRELQNAMDAAAAMADRSRAGARETRDGGDDAAVDALHLGTHLACWQSVTL